MVIITELTKNEIKILIQVLNQPRNQDLQTAMACINLNNKLGKMIDEIDKPKEDKPIESEVL